MSKPKYIESPERMYELFQAYKKEVKENPRKINVFGGKDFNKRDNELERPLTMEGFECYCMDNTRITYPDLTNYFENRNEAYNDFVPICARVRREIRQDQIEGGMVGQYNPSITQRLNSLVDKQELKAQVEQPLFDLGDKKTNKN